LAEAYNVLGDFERRRQYDVDLAQLRRRTDVVPEPLILTGRYSRAAAPFASDFNRPLSDWLDFLEFIFADQW